jgi:hypothetical protein
MGQVFRCPHTWQTQVHPTWAYFRNNVADIMKESYHEDRWWGEERTQNQ